MTFENKLDAGRPRFCPHCGVERPDLALCSMCGDALVDQGYCGTCERFWPLPVGASCPKHDLALDDQPISIEPWRTPGEMPSLVTVGTFSHAGRADAVRIRLEAEGIPTFLQGERMGNASMYNVATGGVALQVPETFASDARILLSQTWAAPVDEDDLDDAWDSLAPDPGASRRQIMKGLILVILLGPFVVAGLAFLLRL